MWIFIDNILSLNKAHNTQDIYTDMITTIQNVKIHWIPFTRSSFTTNTAKMKKISLRKEHFWLTSISKKTGCDEYRLKCELCFCELVKFLLVAWTSIQNYAHELEKN